jgi:octaprenyl-diphosphate synthase
MDYLSSIRKPIDNDLKEFEIHFKKSLKSPVPLLEIITNYILRRKGKQMRPLFVFLSAKLVGDVTRSTFTAATLIELLHTATLIHDDVVDESYERRNFFSLNAIWKSKISVLVGDYLLSKGLLVAVADNELQLLKTVSEAVQDMSEGELLQIQSARKTIIDIDNYFEIIKKKTASLIAACALSGAQSASATEEQQALIKEFGILAGIAFQIKDDLFDYQEKGLIGKPTGNDIKEKKFTLPLILALKNAQPAERKIIIRLVNNNHNNQAKINEVVSFVYKNNGIKEAEGILDDYKTKALNILDNFPDNEAKKSMIELVNYIIIRNK